MQALLVNMSTPTVDARNQQPAQIPPPVRKSPSQALAAVIADDELKNRLRSSKKVLCWSTEMNSAVAVIEH